MAMATGEKEVTGGSFAHGLLTEGLWWAGLFGEPSKSIMEVGKQSHFGLDEEIGFL